MTLSRILPSRQRLRRPVAVLIAVGALGLGLGVGAAYGYFKASGSGSGQASTGSGQKITIAANATAGSLLQPGATGDLVITATNPNKSTVYIETIALGTVSAAGCTAPAITLTTPSTFLPFPIPANPTPQRLVIPGALTMGTGASSDCQGKTFAINLTVTAQL